MGSRSKRLGVRTKPFRKRVSREQFIALFNANPCNTLPGPVLQSLYRQTKSTASLNAAAKAWLKHRAELLS